MKITRFSISNFKGILSTSINITDEVPGRAIPIVGLNESGKTTILEAISYFITEDRDVKSLLEESYHFANLEDIIPKDKKGAFSDVISIKAHIRIDNEDKKILVDHFLEKHNLILNRSRIQIISQSIGVLYSKIASIKVLTYYGQLRSMRRRKAKRKTLTMIPASRISLFGFLVYL